jgi:hypothetical protein
MGGPDDYLVDPNVSLLSKTPNGQPLGPIIVNLRTLLTRHSWLRSCRASLVLPIVKYHTDNLSGFVVCARCSPVGVGKPATGC